MILLCGWEEKVWFFYIDYYKSMWNRATYELQLSFSEVGCTKLYFMHSLNLNYVHKKVITFYKGICVVFFVEFQWYQKRLWYKRSILYTQSPFTADHKPCQQNSVQICQIFSYPWQTQSKFTKALWIIIIRTPSTFSDNLCIPTHTRIRSLHRSGDCTSLPHVWRRPRRRLASFSLSCLSGVFAMARRCRVYPPLCAPDNDDARR